MNGFERLKSGLYVPRKTGLDALKKPEHETNEIDARKLAKKSCRYCWGRGEVKTPEGVYILCRCVQRKLAKRKLRA